MKRPSRPTFVLLAVVASTIALVIAVGLQIFVLNPATENNRNQLRIQQRTLHAVICAQAQSTANAYRFRSLTPSGKVEGIRHFLTRMQAQQQTLRLSRGLGCKSTPGFPPFGMQVNRALEQIGRILSRFGAGLKKPVSQPILPPGTEPTQLREYLEEDRTTRPPLGALPGDLGEQQPHQPHEPSPPAPSPPSAPPPLSPPPLQPEPVPAPVETVPSKPPPEPLQPGVPNGTDSIVGNAVEETGSCTVIRQIYELC